MTDTRRQPPILLLTLLLGSAGGLSPMIPVAVAAAPGASAAGASGPAAATARGVLTETTLQRPDPMRPSGLPPEMLPAGGVNAGLQTVILRQKGKSVAVVNGGHLKEGDRYGDRRVVGIAESEVTLAGNGRTEVLRATPAVRKVMRAKTAEPETAGGKEKAAR